MSKLSAAKDIRMKNVTFCKIFQKSIFGKDCYIFRYDVKLILYQYFYEWLVDIDQTYSISVFSNVLLKNFNI